MDVVQPFGQEGRIGPGVSEIERKFLVANLPPAIIEQMSVSPYGDISQGYLADGDRIRRTVKSTGEVSYEIVTKTAAMYFTKGVDANDEDTRSLSKEKFNELWEQTAGGRIEKRRYFLPHGDYVLELDIFRGGEIDGHMMAEVEFPTTEEALRFTPPEWCSQDVTGLIKNSQLARGKKITLYHLQQSAVFPGFGTTPGT